MVAMNNLNHFALSALLVALVMQSPLATAQQRPAAESQPNPGASGPAQQQHRRGPKKFKLENAQDASIQLWKPDLSTLPLTARHGSVTLPFTGVDNYHALVVHKDWGNLQETLIRYVYMHGKPSGHSTRELTAAEKASFEIVPDPVPREHQHYHSAQRWNFLLRFNGAPAASVPVRLLTSNGSELGSVSDANGRVSLMVPDDFSLLGPDVRDRRTAEFSLSAELERDGINHQTQLSAEYRVDPGRWQSLGLGVFVTGIGLVAGGLLGRKALRSS